MQGHNSYPGLPPEQEGNPQDYQEAPTEQFRLPQNVDYSNEQWGNHAVEHGIIGDAAPQPQHHGYMEQAGYNQQALPSRAIGERPQPTTPEFPKLSGDLLPNLQPRSRTESLPQPSQPQSATERNSTNQWGPKSKSRPRGLRDLRPDEDNSDVESWLR